MNSCTCEKCQHACERIPGEMTPLEAERAIAAGEARRLMLNWYYRRQGNVYWLMPAVTGSGGEVAPYWPKGRCMFLTDGNLCDIHYTAYKPIVCRQSFLCDEDKNARVLRKRDLVRLWDTDKGRAVIKQWESICR